MIHGLKVFAAILPLFIALDYLWIVVLMKSFYLQEIGDMARTTKDGRSIQPRLGSAAGVYLALPGGIVLFALPHVDPTNLLFTALLWGGLFGVTVYSVYDLTNRATLSRWPVKLVVTDIVWAASFVRWPRSLQHSSARLSRLRPSSSFSRCLPWFIQRSGFDEVEVYKRAYVDRNLLSKIRSDADHNPRKATVIAFSVAFHPSVEEMR